MSRSSHYVAPPIDRALVWLRRDLRLNDQAALHHALAQARQVWCAFVFDTTILDALPRADRRVEFIHASLAGLDAALRAQGSALIVRHGDPCVEIPALAGQLGVQAVHAARDYEPAAVARDAQVRGQLAHAGVALHTHKDQVIFEADEVLTANGTPFSVFTPYRNAWLRRLEPRHLQPWGVAPRPGQLAAVPAALERGLPSLADLDFLPTGMAERLRPGEQGAARLLEDFLQRIDRYAQARDFPAVKGPSYLSVHLRFGTVSVRQLARLAHERMTGGSRGAEVWLSELIWREFYQQLLHHHPRVEKHAFKPEYDRIHWEHGAEATAHFAAWCEGRTGYPIVDAAMRQLVQTGYMHNRLRMIVASFLTKDLGLDWRRGEAWFARQLNDFDLAANNGGWQWAASTGCDAQPWFRIFNPVSQSRKFDPEGRFIRRYVPEIAALDDTSLHAPWEAPEIALAGAGIVLGRDYPRPIVDHAAARARTLERYAVVKATRD
ncbi:MAG: DNA photolyase family protein [Burkholderiaceae bacterium]|nr:DNA photolyase family protein [Burkholderiaceae bacterium]